MHAELDIEDLAAGVDSSALKAPRSARLAGVAPHSHARESQPAQDDHQPNSSVPGTQRIWLKTFGCSHNTSDSEYMAGQLAEYGYNIVDDASSDEADLWLINSCTVKGPSQAAVGTLVRRARQQGKAVVVAGCVPQGDRKAQELEDVSLLGVTQIDRVVEAVEETLKGNTVQLLKKKALPRLDLPKVRTHATRFRICEMVFTCYESPAKPKRDLWD